MVAKDACLQERLSLGGADWVTAPFLGEEWRLRQAYRRETAATGWLPATVPGSVHFDLLRAGEIADPYFERNSRLAEWVHQRDWVFKRDFTVPRRWAGRRITLHLAGIDSEAQIYLDGERLGEHRSMFAPALLDLTGRVRSGERHHLAIAVKAAPPAPPQLGRTSEVRTHKPRMGYGWDFAGRLVNLGLWQEVSLEATGATRLADVWVRPRLRGAGARITVCSSTDGPAAELTVELLGSGGNLVATGKGGEVSLRVDEPALWWPQGWGQQPLYTCRVTARTGGMVSDRREVAFGIRSLTLAANPWPPPGVAPAGEAPRPCTFTVNGRRIFIKGCNWAPVELMYGRGDLAERYRHLIALAQRAGCNLLRVWGGGLIERELFYDLCDHAGMLVWQEFILSSAGTDNVPASDPAYVALLEHEAEAIIPARRNHPSLALWCGGNELTDAGGVPATTREPALATLARAVERLDPDRPFLPASPSGPVFECTATASRERPAELHDVHGPWGTQGSDETYHLYNLSTALFHSEFGAQGAAAPASLARFMSPARQWPPDETNPIWLHHGGWWLHREQVQQVFGEVRTLDRYWRLSQLLQAESVRYAVEANRRRWPACSGAVVWQLNEPWPNAHCTSLVDYYLRPKMAYYYLKRAFAPVAGSLRYDSQALADGVLRARPFIVADRPHAGRLAITIADPTGRVWHRTEGLEELVWPLPPGGPEVAIVTLVVNDDTGQAVHNNPYLFSRAAAPIFRSLVWLPLAEVEAVRAGDTLVLRNHGPGYAFFPAVDVEDPRFLWLADDNYPLLAPGETVAIRLWVSPRSEPADSDCPAGGKREGPLHVRVSGLNMRSLALAWD
ncbi:MAG: glycoside hydrolase family 2 TIM barrel-domain containing protein [Acidobacteriota bacterium]